MWAAGLRNLEPIDRIFFLISNPKWLLLLMCRRKDLKNAVDELRKQLRKPTKKASTISVLKAAQEEIQVLDNLMTDGVNFFFFFSLSIVGVSKKTMASFRNFL